MQQIISRKTMNMQPISRPQQHNQNRWEPSSQIYHFSVWMVRSDNDYI